MPVDFTISTVSGASSGTVKGDASSTPESGVFMGRQTTRIDSPASLLAEAAEELALFNGPEDGVPDCELDERKEEDDEKTKRAEDELKKVREEGSDAIGAIRHVEDKEGKTLRERIREYKMLMASRGLEAGIGQLERFLATDPGADVLLERAVALCADETDTWVILASLLEQKRASGASPELIRVVREALASLEKSKAPHILTGLYGALTAPGFTEAGDVETLRDAYRCTVCDFATALEVFIFVQEKFADNFEPAMDFLFAALSADMASDAPSMGKKHLAGVNGSLGKVRLIQNAYQGCDELLDRWENVHGVHGTRAGGCTAMSLLEKFLLLGSERFLGAAHIENIAMGARIPDVEREVLFYQELLRATRRFPIPLFDDEAGRMKVLDAVQECVDRAVEREDEWLMRQEKRDDA